MNPIIEQLHATLNALRAEWEGLSERRRDALLAGSRDALLDAEVRKIQIPYEAVSACTQAVHTLLAELDAEARELEAERDTLAEQLRAFEPEVRALWERIRPVQERYLRIRNAGHSATLYTITWGAPDLPAEPDSRLQLIYQMEIPRCKQAIEWLEKLTARVAAQEEQAVGEAVQLLYGVAPAPTEKILKFRLLVPPVACLSVAEAGAAQHPAPAAVAEPSSEPRREPSREPRVRIKRREGVMGEGEAPSAYTAGAAAAVAAAE